MRRGPLEGPRSLPASGSLLLSLPGTSCQLPAPQKRAWSPTSHTPQPTPLCSLASPRVKPIVRDILGWWEAAAPCAPRNALLCGNMASGHTHACTGLVPRHHALAPQRPKSMSSQYPYPPTCLSSVSEVASPCGPLGCRSPLPMSLSIPSDLRSQLSLEHSGQGLADQMVTALALSPGHLAAGGLRT